MANFLAKAKKIATNEIVCLSTMLTALIFGVFYLDHFGHNPLEKSLSQMGRESHPSLFIIWSVLAGIALLCNVNRMYNIVGYTNKLGRWLLYVGLLFLVLTFANMKKEPEIWYWIHVVTAVIFSVFILFSVALGLLSMWKKSKRYQGLAIAFCALCLIDIVFLAIYTQMALYEFIPLLLVYIVLFFTNFTQAFRPEKLS